MNDNTSKTELEKLRLQRDAKFDEIVAVLTYELYGALGSNADYRLIVEEAEELTDKWATADADGQPLENGTKLQTLLIEHQKLCKCIIEIVDSGAADND
jgi:hypothetical protein